MAQPEREKQINNNISEANVKLRLGGICIMAGIPATLYLRPEILSDQAKVVGLIGGPSLIGTGLYLLARGNAELTSALSAKLSNDTKNIKS